MHLKIQRICWKISHKVDLSLTAVIGFLDGMQRVLQLVALVACFAVVSSLSNGVISLDKYTFDKIVGKERPVLVRFDQDYSVFSLGT